MGEFEAREAGEVHRTFPSESRCGRGVR
jgi:hypothetical protein